MPLAAPPAARVPVLLALALAPLSCGDDPGDLRTAGTPGLDSAADSAAGDTAPGDTADTAVVDPCASDVPRPDPAVPADTIGTLTVLVRTGDATYDGTDGAELSLCLTATDCFRLANAGVDDFETGALDVFHVDAGGLPRSAVDRVRLVQGDGDNRWTPACLALRFDGEPVHCEDDLGVRIGNGSGETMDWTDPAGLHQDCDTCADGTLLNGPMVAPDGPETARVWVRSDAGRDVAVRVAEGDDPAGGRIAGWARPAAEDDFTAVVEVGCLAPGRRYAYRVEIDGEPIPGAEGTLATTPEPGATGTWRVAVGSCSKDDDQPIFATILDAEPDLFVFGGDNHYANTDKLPALRAAYRWALERPERAEMVANVPILATWDDHDFVGNNTDGTAEGRDVAARAFAEYWGHALHGLQGTPGIFSRTTWGDVDLFLVDDRYYRGIDDSMLGEAQLAWLMEGLASSTATFKLVVSGSQWTSEGSDDSWASFPEEREALFDFLDERGVTGVVLISGDKHRSEFRWLPRRNAYALPEITSSNLANEERSRRCPTSSDEVLACYGEGQNVVLLDVDTTARDPSLTATMVDEEGTTLEEWTIRASELE